MASNNGQGSDYRIPPQDLAAEKSLIGAILLSSDVIDEVSRIVGEMSFYADAHQRVFRTTKSMHDSGKPVDTVTVATALEESGELEEVGGPSYLVELMETVPHTAHAVTYAKTIRDRYQRRVLQQSASRILQQAGDYAQDVSGLVAEAESDLHRVLDTAGRFGPVDLRDSLNEAFDELHQSWDAGEQVKLPTGFCDLDELTGGMASGNLVVLAARPSMGKTSLAVNVLMNVAKCGQRCVIYSLEQSRVELTIRIISGHSGISSNRLHVQEIDEFERQKVLQSCSELQELPLLIDDKGGLKLSEIASSARLEKRRRGLELVVIDYLQLIEPDDKRVQREQQVATLSRGLNLIAKDLQLPVICLAQLNRQVEQRVNKKPMLADLRESGALEQDADQVWMIYRPSEYQLDDQHGEPYADSFAQLVVAKHRNGSTGTVDLHWDKETTTFRSAASTAHHRGF